MSPEHPFAQLVRKAISSATGTEPPTIGMTFTTDARFVRNQAGIPAVVCGPGNIAQAHGVDEWVSVSQLVDATAAYAELPVVRAWHGFPSADHFLSWLKWPGSAPSESWTAVRWPTVMAPPAGFGPRDAPAPAPDGTSVSFHQAEGPLASYRRTVEAQPLGAGQYKARQVVELKVGLPWWSWLLSLPLRFSLGRAEPERLKTGTVTEVRLPWWAPPQRLDRRQALVMATLAALVSVQGFLIALLPETLTYAASEMHLGTFGQGAVFALVELSALPALLALVVADRRGRRSVVLWATGVAAVLSELGGFTTSAGWLTLTQVSAGALVAAAGIGAIVVAVEEVPRGCHAWAVGVLGMAGGFGGGIPLLLLPLAGTGPGGWRWLYWLSLLSLPVVIVCARQLPESRRWVGRRPLFGEAERNWRGWAIWRG